MVVCLAGGPPGYDRNYLPNGPTAGKTLGARTEYLRKKYVPEEGKKCRALCPRTLFLDVPYEGRHIQVFISSSTNAFFINPLLLLTTSTLSLYLARILLLWKD